MTLTSFSALPFGCFLANMETLSDEHDEKAPPGFFPQWKRDFKYAC
jgi:hypothetical protein